MQRFVILGMLRSGEALHGYGLMKVYREGTGGELSVGNIYRELQGLLALGWVRAAAKPPEADPRRVPYEITRAGAAAFDAWLATPAELRGRPAPGHLAVRAFLVARAGGALPADILERWRQELALRQALLERDQKAMHARRSSRPGDHALLADTLVRWRLQQLSTDIALLQELRDGPGVGTLRCNGHPGTVPRARTIAPSLPRGPR